MYPSAPAFVFLLVAVLNIAFCHPTLYKIKDDRLERDLIPVSSTVIPLPIYRVESSFATVAGKSSLVKPDGPVTLLTVHGEKALAQADKGTLHGHHAKKTDKKQ